MTSRRVGDFSERASEEGRLFQLDTINELRNKAKLAKAAWKRKVETKHLSKVYARKFRERDPVLRKAGETQHGLGLTEYVKWWEREHISLRLWMVELCQGHGMWPIYDSITVSCVLFEFSFHTLLRNNLHKYVFLHNK